ncbi:hypothetical protein SAMN05443253_101654 [Bacillus sp. OK048]|nr:hypothetical protein SAMN05443253_101654 [Bacillus sp. OK048]
MKLLSNLEYEKLKAFFGRIIHCLSLAKMTIIKENTNDPNFFRQKIRDRLVDE